MGGGGEVKESTFKGFMETFDSTKHHMAAQAVRQRLESSVRDDSGRFRIAPGSSLLREKEPQAKVGISLAELQAQAEAERAAKEAARHKKRKPAAAEDGAAAAEKRGRAAQEPPAAPATGSWLALGIVVKLLSREPPEQYKAKGVVRRVLEGGRAAEVELLDGGARVEAAAATLETVLPKPGGRVLVVAGRYAGARGVLTGVDVDAFKAGVRLQDAPHEGLQVQLEYEQVCKTEAQ